MHRDIIFIHIDVITITLSMPEPQKAPPLQTATFNHPVEQQLCIIKDSLSLHTCRKHILLRSDMSVMKVVSLTVANGLVLAVYFL